MVSERSPSTKAAQGSNCAHLSARYDERTGTVIVLSAIDNLVKGTAGQAIQCMNLMVGLPEHTGLPTVGLDAMSATETAHRRHEAVEVLLQALPVHPALPRQGRRREVRRQRHDVARARLASSPTTSC